MIDEIEKQIEMYKNEWENFKRFRTDYCKGSICDNCHLGYQLAKNLGMIVLAEDIDCGKSDECMAYMDKINELKERKARLVYERCSK